MWNKAKHGMLRAEGCDARLANVILNEGCDTFAQFCEKWSVEQMMLCPGFGHKSRGLVRELAKQKGITLREATPVEPPNLRYRMIAFSGEHVAFERRCVHFAQIGGHIGNLVGDVSEIRVFDGDLLILVYMSGGIFLGPKLSEEYSEAALEAAMRDLP